MAKLADELTIESKDKAVFSLDSDKIIGKKQSQSPKIQDENTETAEPKTVFTTHRRHIHRKHKYGLPTAKSNLSSIYSFERELGLSELFSGDMTHTSFACPFNLREAFKTETKLNGTSTCQELRRFMSAYVASSRMQKIAFGSRKIVDAKVSIGALNFTQNVQSRPRRLLRGVEVRGAQEVSKGASVEASTCMIGSCGKPAVEVMVYQPKGMALKEFQVCASHASLYAESAVWRFKK